VEAYIRERAAGLLLDHYISHTADDIAILMTLPGEKETSRFTNLTRVLFGPERTKRGRKGYTEPGRTCSRIRFRAT
jgi:hypothetical protein